MVYHTIPENTGDITCLVTHLGIYARGSIGGEMLIFSFPLSSPLMSSRFTTININLDDHLLVALRHNLRLAGDAMSSYTVAAHLANNANTSPIEEALRDRIAALQNQINYLNTRLDNTIFVINSALSHLSTSQNIPIEQTLAGLQGLRVSDERYRANGTYTLIGNPASRSNYYSAMDNQRRERANEGD